jgi:hypothetical protein
MYIRPRPITLLSLLNVIFVPKRDYLQVIYSSQVFRVTNPMVFSVIQGVPKKRPELKALLVKDQ